jgi:hypothetical protein
MYNNFRTENKPKQVIRKTVYLKNWLRIDQDVDYPRKFKQDAGGGQHLLSIVCQRNCFSQSFAVLSSVKLFMGMGGGFNMNRIFIINLARPGLDTMAIAE